LASIFQGILLRLFPVIPAGEKSGSGDIGLRNRCNLFGHDVEHHIIGLGASEHADILDTPQNPYHKINKEYK